MEQCIDGYVKDYNRSIHETVYDFFMLETAILVRKWNVPVVCSISAVPFTGSSYTAAIQRVDESIHGGSVDDRGLALEHLKDSFVPIGDGYGSNGSTSQLGIRNIVYMSNSGAVSSKHPRAIENVASTEQRLDDDLGYDGSIQVHLNFGSIVNML